VPRCSQAVSSCRRPQVICEVIAVDATYRCRGGAPSLVVATPVVVEPTSKGTSTLETFAAGLMNGMVQMQQTQQKMLEFMSFGAGGLSTASRPLRSLAALSDLQGHAVVPRYQEPLLRTSPVVVTHAAELKPTLAIMPPTPAPTMPNVEEWDSQTPEKIAGDNSLPETSAMVPAATTPTSSFNSGMAELMGLLSVRDANKRKAAAGKKQQGGKEEDGAGNCGDVESTAAVPIEGGDKKRPRVADAKRAAAVPIEGVNNKRPRVADAEGVSSGKADAGKKPYFAVERSRNQVMCRTGLGGPGSSHKIPYGPKEKAKTEAAAVAMGKVWVNHQMELRGIK